MLEIGAKQSGIVALVVEGRSDGLVEFVEIVGNEVVQIVVLGMFPALFFRIKGLSRN